MEIITIPLLIVACLIWFFSTWETNRNHAEYLRKMDEAEEAAYRRQKAHWDDLRAKREAGDEQATEMCKLLGLR